MGGVGRSRLLLRLACLATAVAAATTVTACGSRDGAAPTLRSAAPPAGVTQTRLRTHARLHAHDNIDATAITHEVPVFRSPHNRHPFLKLANPTAVGEPLVFLVRRRADGWEEVYLPVRPDGTTGWIEDRDVELAWNPYSVQVNLHDHKLVVIESGRVEARYPAAVGRSVLPTPRGRYYIVDLLKQPNPNGLYGPYAFGTSAFSHILYSFGGGPGQIGIHGTDDPSSIGRSVSHGCIRLTNTAIVHLAHQLPLGTPITINS